MPDNDKTTTTDHENNKKPRKIGCITIMWVVAFVGGGIFWFNGLREVPLSISPDTTYIIEPLTPDGKRVDYLTAYKQMVEPPNIATDDNGYRLVFQHLGDAGFSPTLPPGILRQCFEELGLNPNTQPDMKYQDFYTFLDQVQKRQPEELEDLEQMIRDDRKREQKEQRQKRVNEINADESLSDEEKAELIAEIEAKDENAESEQSIEILGAKFSTESIDFYQISQKIERSNESHTFPLMQRWVEENSPALDIIGEGVAKPVYSVPFVLDSHKELQWIVSMMGNMQEVRSFARGLFPRAKYRVDKGDFDGAIDDILACYRLGRHVGNNGMLVEALVGIAIEGMATAASIDANPTERPTAEQLERLAESIRNLPPRVKWQTSVEIDRYFALDAIQMMAHNVKDREIYLQRFDTKYGKYLTNLGYDWNVIAKKYNEGWDAVLAGTQTPRPYPGFNPLQWLTLRSRSDHLGYYMSDSSAAEAAKEAFRRAECVDNMRQITLAMLIYERRNGTLPPTFSVDENGKPLHSWRVLLLPYLGDETLTELYSQIKLDEPWDSEHNRQFHTRNLDIYRCPSAVKKDGEANYSVIVDDDLLFGNDGKGRSLDGRKRHQIMLAERKGGVCWMQPDAEITQHAAETDGINKTATSFGSNHTGGANFGLRDGGVNFLTETMNPNQLNDLIRGTDTKGNW